MQPTDATLVRRFQEGDPTAFDALVLRYQPRILRLVTHILHSAQDAEDIAQEVFLRAYRGLPRFRGDASFETWLTRITVNTCARELRRRRLRKSLMLPLRDVPQKPQLLANLEKEEEQRLVHDTLKRLSPRHRIVLSLYYLEELSCEQIAAILGCSCGTIKSRLYHARKRLRKLLLPYYADARPIFRTLDERDAP